ncbi:MAG: MmcQ/YjbR family DNA-binding protein [Bacteroidales bacterium]
MNSIEDIREYCLSKQGVHESLPFNDTALVFKVGDKLFALLDLSDKNRGITLKCDPDLVIELREQHPEITPAFHFNKKHWNTIYLSGNMHYAEICKLIDHSYELAFGKLTKKMQREIKEL